MHVPYRSSFMPDLLSGQVQVMFCPIPQAIAYIRSGKLRALAVTTATRLEALPNIPTVGEFVPGYEAVGWFGLCAPRSTSDDAIKTLNAATNTALADPQTKARLANLGVVPMPTSPAGFGKLIAHDLDKWAKVVRTANIKPE